MFVTVTIRMQAEDRAELADGFVEHVEACKEHFETLREGDVFGPRAKVQMRYLVLGGKGMPQQQQVVERGTPSLE